MSTLSKENKVDSVIEILDLLNLVMPFVPSVVFRLKSADIVPPIQKWLQMANSGSQSVKEKSNELNKKVSSKSPYSIISRNGLIK